MHHLLLFIGNLNEWIVDSCGNPSINQGQDSPPVKGCCEETIEDEVALPKLRSE